MLNKLLKLWKGLSPKPNGVLLMLMLDLQWYKGIKADIKSAKKGKGIVLYADADVCRVLSYVKRLNNELFIVTAYPSVSRTNKVNKLVEPFNFKDTSYLLAPAFIYSVANAASEEQIKALYHNYCEKQEDPMFDAFLKALGTTGTRTKAQKPNIQHSIKSDIDLEEAPNIKEGETAKGMMIIACSPPNDSDPIAIKVEFEIKNENGKKEIVKFYRKKMEEDLYRAMRKAFHKEEEKPTEEEAKKFAADIIEKVVESMKEHDIDFDPEKFE